MGLFPHRRNKEKKLNPIMLWLAKFIAGAIAGVCFCFLAAYYFLPLGSKIMFHSFWIIPIVMGFMFAFWFDKMLGD